MTTSPAFKSKSIVLLISISVFLGLGGCGNASSSAPTPPPTLPLYVEDSTPVNLDATAIPVTEPPPTDAPDSVWLDQPFGGENSTDRLAVYFYTGPGDTPCVRYLVSTPGAKVVSGCTTKTGIMAIISGVEPARDGSLFTIITGRVLENKTVVVSFQMENGDTLPVSVDNGGIILILPGQRHALQAVPIDQFGNLTGNIYTFPK